jgi:hypothetical protein
MLSLELKWSNNPSSDSLTNKMKGNGNMLLLQLGKGIRSILNNAKVVTKDLSRCGPIRRDGYP